MRAVHVISGLDPRGGGPVTALQGLATALAHTGVDVTVVATFSAGADLRVADQLRAAGVAVHTVGPVRGRLRAHHDLTPTLEHTIQAADVVHIHALWEPIQHHAARQARAHGVPYVIRPCGMLDPWSLRQSAWRKRLYLACRLRRDLHRAAALHFTSEVERDGAGRLNLQTPAIVEPNGIALDEYQALPAQSTFRAHHPQTQGRPLLLFLSRLHRKKGLGLLIPAFAQVLQASAAKPMLVLAGPCAPQYRRRLESEIASHGLSDHVIFTGMLEGEQKRAALTDADLFVLPSYQENFGIAVIEALAAGTPVVVSDQVNICGRIAEGQVGAVVPTRIEPLAESLTRWMSDARLREDAAERARPFVQAHFDWGQIAEHWATHYARLSNAGARHAEAPSPGTVPTSPQGSSH